MQFLLAGKYHKPVSPVSSTLLICPASAAVIIDPSPYMGRIKNRFHRITRLLKKTRAYNSCISTLWLNAAGIKTAKVLLLFEGKGTLGARESFLVTEEIDGDRLDDFLEKNLDYDLSNDIKVFFKRMKWIQFSHGDAKTSNYKFR